MAAFADLPVVILCGGRGARLQESVPSLPKPLVEIGGRPILWHVIQIYAAQGFSEFVLATGYKGDQIEAFVTAERWPADVGVRCLYTGVDTPTGGRVRRAAEDLGERPFCATYADGVSDVDLDALVSFHRGHDALATLTVVRPELQFGITEVAAGGRVTGFREKPRSDHWINGGFFCFEAGVRDYLDDETALEREPLEALAADGELRAYCHTGFWECMDTYKDAVSLNDLWRNGGAPWKMWE